MTSERLLIMSIEVLYSQNTFIPPQNIFLATPLIVFMYIYNVIRTLYTNLYARYATNVTLHMKPLPQMLD